MPKVRSGALPKYRNIRLNIENSEISMFASMRDDPITVTFETKKIRKITIQPTSVRRLFLQVETEEILIEFSETPRIPVSNPISAQEAELSGEYPILIIGKRACGNEFDVYKKQFARFAQRNSIAFTDLTQKQDIEEESAV